MISWIKLTFGYSVWQNNKLKKDTKKGRGKTVKVTR